MQRSFSTPNAASCNASDKEGWACIILAISSEDALNSSARTVQQLAQRQMVQ